MRQLAEFCVLVSLLVAPLWLETVFFVIACQYLRKKNQLVGMHRPHPTKRAGREVHQPMNSPVHSVGACQEGCEKENGVQSAGVLFFCVEHALFVHPARTEQFRRSEVASCLVMATNKRPSLGPLVVVVFFVILTNDEDVIIWDIWLFSVGMLKNKK